jgi:release factor glutamine methyltransferase
VTSNPPITVGEIIDRTTQFFQQKGIESPRLDAQLLIAHALGKSRLELYLQFDYPLDETELARARELVRRRAAREPVAYILGKKEFAGREFKVAPGVLIPRPDTEVLVDEVQRELTALAAAGGETSAVRLLEFGIGSGAIAVTLAAENPALQLIATEISPAAAAIARENSEAHEVADRVEIRLQADFSGIEGPFHGVISNPPYIAPAEKQSLAPEVRDHEPPEALFAEDDGLHWYRFLAAEARRLLAPGGFLAVEIGYQQRERVETIFRGAGFSHVRSVKDFGGNDRVVVARAE